MSTTFRDFLEPKCDREYCWWAAHFRGGTKTYDEESEVDTVQHDAYPEAHVPGASKKNAAQIAPTTQTVLAETLIQLDILELSHSAHLNGVNLKRQCVSRVQSISRRSRPSVGACGRRYARSRHARWTGSAACVSTITRITLLKNTKTPLLTHAGRRYLDKRSMKI